MAANNYYNSAYANPHNTYTYNSDTYDRRYQNEAPLPPLPSNSPFDDGASQNSYPYSHNAPSQSYSGASGRVHPDADPFDDGNAIMLNGRRKHESTASVAPILPPPDDDPFVRDAKRMGRNRERTRDRDDEGWFRGKITWVCFAASVVQLVVFIAEIAKNGMFMDSFQFKMLGLTTALMDNPTGGGSWRRKGTGRGKIATVSDHGARRSLEWLPSSHSESLSGRSNTDMSQAS